MSHAFTYRRRPSALHSARAGVASALCLAPGLVALMFDHPLVLAGALGAVAIIAMGARVGAEVRRAARLALPLALLIAVVNPLVSREGDTVILRAGEILGRRIDVTLEAAAFGGVAGLRILVIALAFALLSAAVDPDDLLRLFRRFSYRSALTATLTTRLVPALARDATRMSEAARCRPVPPGRTAVARAAVSGALDRAADIAAALEVRGYSLARPASRGRSRAWSRHDASVASAACAVVALAVGARVAGAGGFEPYPLLAAETGPAELLLACGLPLLAWVPFAGTSARLGVARG